MMHMGSDHKCALAHFVFLVTKQINSQIKYKTGKNTSETAHILDQDNDNLNSEKSTKFEEKYNELRKRIMTKSASDGKTKEDKKEQVETKKRRTHQLTLGRVCVIEAAAANPSRVNDTPLDESAIDVDAVAKTKEGEEAAAAVSRESQRRRSRRDSRRRRVRSSNRLSRKSQSRRLSRKS